jgi:hypothetical protein
MIFPVYLVRMGDVNKPIEVYCPICGFNEAINSDDARLKGKSRDEKIVEIRALQDSDAPFFTCDKCDSPAESAKIIEIR